MVIPYSGTDSTVPIIISFSVIGLFKNVINYVKFGDCRLKGTIYGGTIFGLSYKKDKSFL